MIFSKADHIQQIIDGSKTMTRRPTDRYKSNRLYAIQPGRGKHGIPDGKIYTGIITREWKPDLSGLPEDAVFARGWKEMEAGYPIRDFAAKAEGGYTSKEFEELYEKMYPGWTERYAIFFMFFTTEEIEECKRADAENKRK